MAASRAPLAPGPPEPASTVRASGDGGGTPLRIAMLNTSWGPGGASRIVANLHAGLGARGHRCDTLVHTCDEPGETGVHTLAPPAALPVRAVRHALWRLGLNHTAIPSSYRLGTHDALRDADVVNAHNLHGGWFDYLALPRLGRDKPIVWTLHDQWAFTGHCVYPAGCERWQHGCGACPDLELHEPVRRDATALEMRLKRHAYDRTQLHLVAVSEWMGREVGRSLLRDHPIAVIPNGVDLARWSTAEDTEGRAALRRSARERLGLDAEESVIAFCAHALADRRKGFDRLVEALGDLPDARRKAVRLVAVGRTDGVDLDALPVAVTAMGFVADEAVRRDVYLAADVLGFASREDNLPVVLQEAFACALPAVAFDHGGVSELVRDGESGRLAPADDVAAFSASLDGILHDAASREGLGAGARALVRGHYSLATQLDRYEALFADVIEAHRRRGDMAGRQR